MCRLFITDARSREVDVVNAEDLNEYVLGVQGQVPEVGVRRVQQADNRAIGDGAPAGPLCRSC